MSRARVFDAYGEKGYRKMVQEVTTIADDLYNPAEVFVIGDTRNDELGDCRIFAEALKQHSEVKDRTLHCVAPTTARDGFPVSFCLGSEENAIQLIDLANKGNYDTATETWSAKPHSIKVVVILYPSDEQLKFLSLLLQQTDDVIVFIAQINDPRDPRNDLIPRTEIPGYQGVPENVDFDAAEVAVDEEIPILPASAMYGKAAVWAKMLQTPIGFAYLAVLAVLSLFVKSTATIRAALYVSLMGPVHTGKSLTSTRARALFGLNHGGARAEWCEDRTPASDRAFYKMFAGADPKKRLLEQDEQRDMMSKGGIENSSMFSALCKLWSQNRAGAADKQGLSDCCVELSILGDLKIDEPSEFPGVFTHQTAHGLYDRQLFGVRAGEKWRWTNVEFDPFQGDVVTPEVSEPRLTQPILDLKNTWQDAGKDRDRLAELALRVALITSAANGDPEITVEAMTAALKLMEWQEKIRRVYSPAKGANEYEECVIEIEDTFRAAPGRALNWREISQRKNWHRRFPRAIRGMKKMLIDEGKLGYDKKSGKHFLNETPKEKRS